MCRERLDAHRGLGRQHRHTHPRRARVPAASCSASRSLAVACGVVHTRSTTRATSKPSTPTYTASRSSSSPPTRPLKDPLPPKPVQQVAAVEGREHLRITFPKLNGYRVELPDEDIFLDLEDRSQPLRSDPTRCRAGWRCRVLSEPASGSKVSDREYRTTAGRLRAS